MVSRQIIALSGPRACGKSTIAAHLVNNHGYTRIAFADALRDIAAVAGSNFINDRIYLARLGEVLRTQVPDFLLQAVKNRIELIEGHVVIEDIRFPIPRSHNHPLRNLSRRAVTAFRKPRWKEW